MDILKQIACIGAYAAGFAIGTYGACKAVKAIEKRFPMENNPLEVKITTGGRDTIGTLNEGGAASHGGPVPAV